MKRECKDCKHYAVITYDYDGKLIEVCNRYGDKCGWEFLELERGPGQLCGPKGKYWQPLKRRRHG